MRFNLKKICVVALDDTKYVSEQVSMGVKSQTSMTVGVPNIGLVWERRYDQSDRCEGCWLQEKKAARAKEDEARRLASLEQLHKDMREGGGRGEKVVMDMNNKTQEEEAAVDSDDDDEYTDA
jgi:hypothetical protein